jgi:putative cell wall-binding protein
MGIGSTGTRAMLVALVLAIAAAVIVTPEPATASPEPQAVGRFHVAPGIVRDVHNWQTSRGPVVIQSLRFRLDDPRVTLSPELGLGTIAGREATHETVRRLGPRAVAGVNGTFYRSAPGPWGEPEGLYIRNRTFISEAEQRYGKGWRGGFALFDDGSYDFGYPDYDGFFTEPSATPDSTGHRQRIRGVNRNAIQPIADSPDRYELVLFSRAFGRTTGSPAGTTEITLNNVAVGLQVDTEASIARISTAGNSPIPDNGVVLAATGILGTKYAGFQVGDTVRVELSSTIPWDDPLHAFASGPLLIKDGQPTSEVDWRREGFDNHNTTPHPRTIVGFRADGEMVLLTADGRRNGYSNGLTTGEAVRLMQHLGVTDAVMMDGGGATNMVTDGAIRNRPCCDSAGYRRVSNSFIVFSNVETPGVRRVGETHAWGTARRIARDGWPNGATTAVMASGESPQHAVTAGPLASSIQAPVLLTGRTWLPWSTTQALAELHVRNVILVGNSDAIGAEVVDALRRRGYRVSRVGGEDGVSTAAAVARRAGAPQRHAFLAGASAWTDAAGATQAASRVRAPILLTGRDELPPPTLAALRDLGVREVTVVGGATAVSESVVSALRAGGYTVRRIAGPDGYATLAELTKFAEASGTLSTRRTALVRGDGYQDLLVAGAFGAQTGVPIIASHPLDMDRSPAAKQLLSGRTINLGLLLGAREDLATWVAHQLDAHVTPGPSLPPADITQSCPSDRVPPSGFTDIQGGTHERAISCVAWWEIAKGVSQTSYAPGRAVTRDQMAAFIAQAILASGGSLPSGGSHNFTDISGNVHEGSIRRLAAAGVVSGFPDGSYNPKQPISRQQMATFLVNAYNYRAGTSLSSPHNYFDDISGSVHRSSINAAAHAAFTAGTTPLVYNPSGTVRRDQMASFIARMMNKFVVDNGATLPQ